MIWSRQKRTILIISPVPDAGSLHAAFLRQADIRLLLADGMDQGLELARREQPHLVIDRIEGANGQALDLCRRLKGDPRTRGIPLISVVPPELEDEAKRCGIDACLQQPLVQDEYFEAVRRFIPLPERRNTRIDVNLRLSYWADDLRGQAFTRNVSLDGAFLKTDRALPEGTRIQVGFRLPGQSRQIVCEATVHRPDQQAHPQRGSSGFAIEFQGMAEEDRQRMRAFAERYTRRSLVPFLS